MTIGILDHDENPIPFPGLLFQSHFMGCQECFVRGWKVSKCIRLCKVLWKQFLMKYHDKNSLKMAKNSIKVNYVCYKLLMIDNSTWMELFFQLQNKNTICHTSWIYQEWCYK